jgi:hypothetical protein
VLGLFWANKRKFTSDVERGRYDNGLVQDQVHPQRRVVQ